MQHGLDRPVEAMVRRLRVRFPEVADDLGVQLCAQGLAPGLRMCCVSSVLVIRD